MRNLLVIVSLLTVCAIALAELPDKIQKKVDTAETAFRTAVEKADNARFYAVQKASTERLKLLKQALSEATKSGDFGGAAKIQDLVTAAEATTLRAKPKNLIKIGGHEYAILDDSLTYHNAKKRCEEMGGHLAVFETQQEQDFLLQHLQRLKIDAWIGATNEDAQDQWKWVTGAPVVTGGSWLRDNAAAESEAYAIVFWPDSNNFNDHNLGGRCGYVCEWEK